jgi:hypothetical protein
MTPEQAADRLARLVRRVAWSPHSGLAKGTAFALRKAVDEYRAARDRPTAYDRLLDERDDPFEGDSKAPRCAYSKCGLPFHVRKRGQKYCKTECRKRAWLEARAKNPVAVI